MDTEKPSKQELLKIRLSQDEKAKLEAFAEVRGATVSQVIRRYIGTLPRYHDNWLERRIQRDNERYSS